MYGEVTVCKLMYVRILYCLSMLMSCLRDFTPFAHEEYILTVKPLLKDTSEMQSPLLTGYHCSAHFEITHNDVHI